MGTLKQGAKFNGYKGSGISFEDFKKIAAPYFVDLPELVRDNAIILEFERATGQKYGEIKRPAKKRAPVSNKLAKDKK